MTLARPSLTRILRTLSFVPVKILTDSHFAFGYLMPSGEVFAGGGVYTYDGRDHFSEFIRYHSLPYLVGTRIDFTCRLVGDLWYHDGICTIEGQTQEIHEVWRRPGEGKRFPPDSPKAPERRKHVDARATQVRIGPGLLAGESVVTVDGRCAAQIIPLSGPLSSDGEQEDVE